MSAAIACCTLSSTLHPSLCLLAGCKPTLKIHTTANCLKVGRCCTSVNKSSLASYNLLYLLAVIYLPMSYCLYNVFILTIYDDLYHKALEPLLVLFCTQGLDYYYLFVLRYFKCNHLKIDMVRNQN